MEGDRRVADQETMELLGAGHWELDGTYYLG